MKIRRWFASATALVVTLFLGVTLAQAQDQDSRDHHDQDNRGQDSQDRDHHDRDHHDHDRFDDHDRQAARDWYRDHHDAFRNDEGRYWHQEWEPNIREGFVFTREMRRAVRPVPRDLYARLAPPPRGYRYVVIGHHICLVDGGYRIHDVLHFELNF
jgi:Ni/Co efflux regulator RcnB